MFAVEYGTISTSEGGKPNFRERIINGRPVQSITFVLNSNEWLDGKRQRKSTMVILTGSNLEKTYRYLYGGRKVLVKGEFSSRTESTMTQKGEKTAVEKRFIRTRENIEFLDDEPKSAAENFIKTMFEAGIINAEQQQDFTRKMINHLEKNMKNPQTDNQQQQQQSFQQTQQMSEPPQMEMPPDDVEDANDLSALDDSAINEEDIPK